MTVRRWRIFGLGIWLIFFTGFITYIMIFGSRAPQEDITKPPPLKGYWVVHTALNEGTNGTLGLTSVKREAIIIYRETKSAKGKVSVKIKVSSGQGTESMIWEEENLLDRPVNITYWVKRTHPDGKIDDPKRGATTIFAPREKRTYNKLTETWMPGTYEFWLEVRME